MRTLLLAIVLLLGAPAGAGTVIGPSKCDAAKFKAGGAYAQGLAACRSKAARKGVPVEAACEAKAPAKLQKGFASACTGAGGTWVEEGLCVSDGRCLELQ